MGDARMPHAVAVGKIQPTAVAFLLCGENEQAEPLQAKGYARHLFARNTPQAFRIIETACRSRACGFFPLAEEGQYLLLAPSEVVLAQLCEYLRSQYVREPRNPNAPREQCEQVPLVRAVEFVLSGAVVRPIATGAGGPAGKKYHALYPRTEKTGQEQTLPYRERVGGSENTSGSMHTGITGRSYDALPKRGVGAEGTELKEPNRSLAPEEPGAAELRKRQRRRKGK